MRAIGFVIIAILCATPVAFGRMVVVVGAEGEAAYGRQFDEWADRWAKAAGPMPVVRIGGGGAAADGTTRLAAASPTTSPAADKELLRAAIQSTDAPADTPLWLVLIGHGTAEGQDARFNLRGPDVSDKELAEWLRAVRRPVAVIDCSSASGPFLNRLSAAGRVVVTATRSGSERQFARFGDFISTAITDPAADLDKDGRTSLLEAFLAASRRVDAFYKQAGRIVTEHALLDDNADGQGVSADWFKGVRATRAARTGAAVDGPAANRWFLKPGDNGNALPAERQAERDAVEAEIESLRQLKATMSDADYYARLEPLAVKLAKLYRAAGTRE